jgi:hypothetical protein
MSILGILGGGTTGLWVIGGAAALAVSAIGVQTWRLHETEGDLAQERAVWAAKEADLSQRALEAEQRERAKEQAWAKRSEEITNVTTEKLAAAESAASAAVASAAGLRERAQALAAAGRRSCRNPAAAGGGASAPDALGMFADVLGKLDARASLLAELADKRGIRGEACERFVESLRDRAGVVSAP